MNRSISIIVPVWNEEENIIPLIQKIDASMKMHGISYECIFIDDLSSDATIERLKLASKNYPITILNKQEEKLRGKAQSLIMGIAESKNDIIVMIDADLQYPPEAIPSMLAKLEEGYGVVIANRKTYVSGWFRRLSSRLNALFCGRILHGLPHDIQSGLKIFRKDIIEHIDLHHLSPWAFDLPLLYTARELGYTIGQVDISFEKRQAGTSKISFFKATSGIVLNAFSYKFRPKRAYQIKPDNDSTMVGAGIAYGRKRFITHTTLPHHESAYKTLCRWQKIIFCILGLTLGAGCILNPHATAIIFVAVLSFLYFVDVLFNLFLILKSLYEPPEITCSDEELGNLAEVRLPVYTVLCPLYREAHVLPQFVKAIERMDWPKEKLDVQLLLEEDDIRTIEAAKKMDLPSYFRIIVVPDNKPKTKPKACNYGLAYAKGEFVVIYDAEDKPDPLQLKKAYIAFSKLPKTIACLQAKLNYYNPHHNLLTRLFTAEYSLWFDVVLTGLQSIETSIPLGGTSNHFRTHILRQIHGWDPFNVTEDCDLGARLFKKGFKTAIIDSTTLEEANSNVGNWIRQRSRWIKGFIQTFFVHMRDPITFFRTRGIHAIIFQLVVGGKIGFIFINPILWIITISYFTMYAIVGPAIESLYPSVVFYMAIFSLVFGNFLCMYYYMIGCLKRKHYTLVKFIFFVPFYWLLVSIASVKSLTQLFFKPHYWEKTIHGFHLAKEQKNPVQEQDSDEGKIPNQTYKSSDIESGVFGSIILVASSLLGNMLNFLYNAYLGRVINLEEFGVISLIGSFIYISQVPLGALGSAVTYKSGFLLGKFGEPLLEFWKRTRKKGSVFAFGVVACWLTLSPLLQQFFHTETIIPFLLFTPVWGIGILTAIDSGFLRGNLRFTTIAVMGVTEATVKIALSIVFVHYGLISLIPASVPLSLFCSFLMGWWYAKHLNHSSAAQKISEKSLEFPKNFFLTSILIALTGISYLSIDVLLAKHYLAPALAGSYSFLSLVGKMVFLMGTLVSQFIIPMVSVDMGAGKHTNRIFIRIAGIVLAVHLVSFTVFGVFGYITIPLLWGTHTQGIIPFLPYYCLSMIFYSISSLLITYRQIRGNVVFPVVGFLIGMIQTIGIIVFHRSIEEFVVIILCSGVLSLVTIGTLHIFYNPLVTLYNTLLDFLGIFGQIPQKQQLPGEKLRILIFNWRDLKHKWAGGAEVYIHELAKRWVAMGHDVTVFCGNDGGSKRHETVDGVTIIRRGGFYFVYIWAFLYYKLRLQGHYDIIIDSENGVPFFTPLYTKEKTFLLIHHVHQEVFMKSLVPPFSWLAMFLEKRLMPVAYRNTEVITVSPSSKADILTHKLTKREPQIVYNGVDLMSYKPGRKSRIPLVTYLGRLTTLKSLTVFIKAAEEIISNIPSVRFVIAGDGPDKQRLMRMVKTLKLDPYIAFLGKVTEEEKIRLLQQSWVFVNPSLIEGWGITTIEANACGTPVVASNVQGLRDAVHNPHSGFLVPYGNASEFAHSIMHILNNPRIRTTMSKEALLWAQKFGWDESAEEGIAILQKNI